MQQSLNCPSCGSPVLADQQFCGICGTKLFNPNANPTSNIPSQQSLSSNEPVVMPVTPVSQTVGTGKTRVTAETKSNKYSFLSFAAATFQVFGWIIMILGGLASIAMIVFALMGGGFQPIIPGISNILGGWAVLLGFGCLVISLVTGLVFLAFADLFIAVLDISKNIKLR